jgi:methionyl-tRNA synthetase
MLLRRNTRSPGAEHPIVQNWLYPSDGAFEAPFFSMELHLAPCAVTTAHDHHDTEVWLIVAGQGEVTEDDARYPVGPGDIVQLHPLHIHRVRNTSTDDVFTFVAIWWDNPKTLAESHAQVAKPVFASDTAHVIVRPVASRSEGADRLSYLSGPWLGSDIFQRAASLRGESVIILDGAFGYPPVDTGRADARASGGFHRHGIEHHHQVRAADSTERLFALTGKLFDALHQRQLIVRRRGEAAFCEGCQDYCFDDSLVGTCPICERRMLGNGCGSCFRYFDDAEPVGWSCGRCRQPIATRAVERYYLRLHSIRELLLEFFARCKMSPTLRALVAGVTERELPDVAVTNVARDGVPVPELDEQRISSRLERVGSYLATIEAEARTLASPEALSSYLESRQSLVFLTAVDDDIYTQAVLVPAILLAYAGQSAAPGAFVLTQAHRGSVERSATDAIRFYLAATGPESSASSFDGQACSDMVETVLIGQWQGWLHDIQARLTDHFASAVPEAGPWSPEAKRFYSDIVTVRTEVAAACQAAAFSPRRACQALRRFVEAARQFAECTSPLLRVRSKTIREPDTHMAMEMMAARTLASCVAPIMPRFSAALLEALGESDSSAVRWALPPAFVQPGRQIQHLSQGFFLPFDVEGIR